MTRQGIRKSRVAFFLLSLALVLSVNAEELKSRTFRFDYGATLTGLQPGSRVQVWLPVPPTNMEQTITPLKSDIPAEVSTREEAEYGNKILYFEFKVDAPELSFNVPYRVTRHEVKTLTEDRPVKIDKGQLRRFLQRDAAVPIDGKPLALIKGMTLPSERLELARLLYDRVDEHVTYDKSKPGFGRGDVLWVCDSRFGNCTDFHSLFISLARSQGIPARFEIGFSVPTDKEAGPVSGYHCWAFFYCDDQGWIPVDISEADKNPKMKDYYFGNLTPDRVMFSIGRDITLAPKPMGGPLNFFVFPYVESNGKTLDAAQIKINVSYANE